MTFIPPALAAKIAAHLELFDGFQMMADEQSVPVEQKPADQPKDGDFKSEHSKNAVLADLAKERDEKRSALQERDTLKAQLDKLAPLAKLADALAPDVQADDPTAKMQAAIDNLQKQVADANHRAALAEASKGLSDEDVATLSKITDPDLMAEVGQRLRDAVAAQPANGRRMPKPDPTMGASVDAKSTSVAAGRDLYAERHGKTTN